jgi:flagellar protein FlaG
MVIKAVDPIADIGVAREVKLQHARRASQRPAAPEAPQQNLPQQTAAHDAAQAKQEQKQQETQAETQPSTNPMLQFRVDEDTGRTVAELVDPEGQVLRQMPTEEALEIAKAIGKYQGMFVDLKV